MMHIDEESATSLLSKFTEWLREEYVKAHHAHYSGEPTRVFNGHVFLYEMAEKIDEDPEIYQKFLSFLNDPS